MRSSGVVRDARSRGPHDHVCWAFDDPAEHAARVCEFLADGLAAGARVCYVTTGAKQVGVAPLAGFGQAVRRGAARVLSVDHAYGSGPAGDAAAQVSYWAAAADDAVAAGFTGLRVAADATPLVRTPVQVEAFARYESLIDACMVARPLSGMCAFDRRELDDRTVAELACLHPVSNAGAAPFRLHATDTPGASAALAGELDLAGRELFPGALERCAPEPVDGRVVVDAERLTFVDHRALLALAAYAAGRGATAVLRTRLTSARHLVDVLGLTDLHVEPVG
jgi:hypothetical protein